MQEKNQAVEQDEEEKKEHEDTELAGTPSGGERSGRGPGRSWKNNDDEDVKNDENDEQRVEEER